MTAAVLLRQDYRSLVEELQRGTPTQQLVEPSAANATRLERHLGASPHFALGRWAMAGWLAARAGAREHFADPRVRDVRRQLSSAELEPDLAREIRSLEALLANVPDVGKLTELAEAFGELLATGGRS